MAATFFWDDPRSQVEVAMFLLVCIMVLHAHSRPFRSASLNNFELYSLFSSFLVFFFGQYTMDAGTSGPALESASVLGLLSTVQYICGSLVYYVILLRQSREYSAKDASKGALCNLCC